MVKVLTHSSRSSGFESLQAKMYVFRTLSPFFNDEFHESEDKILDMDYGDICCETQQPC